MAGLAAGEPALRLEGVTKLFGTVTAVDGVDLAIAEGEFFSLLGPSGCGKSTLLRMMAGLESPSAGRILIGGADMTGTPAYGRPVNMMFQSYALFPHMSVEDNIAFGLRQDGVKRAEIRERVAAMLALVQLEGLGRRRPGQLSGGQRQRVALARCLVKRPKVVLLDEPLAALDKRLRQRTQFELMRIQNEVGLTFVMVTHDQEEAMTLSTRIAVMENGRILQVGRPRDIYERPAGRQVADFIGTANFFEGTAAGYRDGHLAVAVEGLASPLLAALDGESGDRAGGPVTLMVRPERIALSRTPPAGTDAVLTGTVAAVAYHGDASQYRVELAGGRSVLVTAANFGHDAAAIDRGEAVFLAIPPSAARVVP